MMKHASTRVCEVAREKLSMMGASSHARPLLRALEEGTNSSPSSAGCEVTPGKENLGCGHP
jgi:hypothetical protein